MFDIVCFCHLRWDFVYQRPQHILTRLSEKTRVFFVEEPVYDENHHNTLSLYPKSDSLMVVVPHLKYGLSPMEVVDIQKQLLITFFNDQTISRYILWYYTPMALTISNHLSPEKVIYDCMDELSNFKFAPPELKDLEIELFEKADLVFTGGHNLYQAKKNCHSNIHPVPSSIDKTHFLKGRSLQNDPEDQKHIPHPRFGFYGVIDERFDLDLLRDVSKLRPNWHFIIIGPVVKIDQDTLPIADNIHYLGGKSYDKLPEYLSGWDIAMVPFLRNDSTRFISPTKTPEYLAAGKPVISTSIVDVIRPYGDLDLVYIADSAEDFISAAEKELATSNKTSWLNKVDDHLKNNSWDNTVAGMFQQIIKLNQSNLMLKPLKQESYV